jgi:formylmethanofuran dehydrogenase subunit E
VAHPNLEQAAQFHGHLGPWLALGLKAGLHARRALGATPFELTARVHCPARPPYSCFVDGVQVGSGCTLGKGNVCHVPGPGCRVEFTCHAGRSAPGKLRKVKPARLVVELRPEAWAELHSDRARGWAAAERLARLLYRRRFAELFVAG